MNKTETMAAMLLTLTQSDEWFRLCDSDEGVSEANDNLQIMIDKLAADNPDEMMEQLWEAVCRVCDACSAVAMLYGIRVANAIHDISAQSLTLTMQVLRQSRVKAGTQGGTKQNRGYSADHVSVPSTALPERAGERRRGLRRELPCI